MKLGKFVIASVFDKQTCINHLIFLDKCKLLNGNIAKTMSFIY